MAEAPSDTRLTADDLTTFIDSESDFAFELGTLKLLSDLGFECEHGGTYDDPHTGTPRQFDLRATTRSRDGDRIARLAVECKNLKPFAPVLVSCTPRIDSESYHELVCSFVQADLFKKYFKGKAFWGATIPSSNRLCRPARLGPGHSMYAPGESVGKAIDHVRRSKRNGWEGGDKEIYNRWSQAISSARDLVKRSLTDGCGDTILVASLVAPVLVVPDDALWTVDFDHAGARVSSPRAADRCSFFIGNAYTFQHASPPIHVAASHLEIVTRTGLRQLAAELLQHVTGDAAIASSLFYLPEVLQRLQGD